MRKRLSRICNCRCDLLGDVIGGSILPRLLRQLT